MRIFGQIIVFLLLVSCEYSKIKKIAGNYYLVIMAGPEPSIAFHSKYDGSNYRTVVDGRIDSIANDSNYIVVLRKLKSINNDTSEYFIIEILEELNWHNYSGVMGPLTRQDFEKRRKEIGISHLKLRQVDM